MLPSSDSWMNSRQQEFLNEGGIYLSHTRSRLRRKGIDMHPLRLTLYSGGIDFRPSNLMLLSMPRPAFCWQRIQITRWRKRSFKLWQQLWASICVMTNCVRRHDRNELRPWQRHQKLYPERYQRRPTTTFYPQIKVVNSWRPNVAFVWASYHTWEKKT
jgi:hypothetical protein